MMLISELISKLIQQMMEFGNIPVFVQSKLDGKLFPIRSVINEHHEYEDDGKMTVSFSNAVLCLFDINPIFSGAIEEAKEAGIFEEVPEDEKSITERKFINWLEKEFLSALLEFQSTGEVLDVMDISNGKETFNQLNDRFIGFLSAISKKYPYACWRSDTLHPDDPNTLDWDEFLVGVSAPKGPLMFFIKKKYEEYFAHLTKKEHAEYINDQEFDNIHIVNERILSLLEP